MSRITTIMYEAPSRELAKALRFAEHENRRLAPGDRWPGKSVAKYSGNSRLENTSLSQLPMRRISSSASCSLTF
jgi:hypothetical protein